MYYIYVLESLKNKSFYIGYTADLKKRLEIHQAGGSRATKFKKPYKLIYYEAFINVKDAKAREEYLKSGWGMAIYKETFEKLSF